MAKISGIDGGQLRSFIERIEKLEDEKRELAQVIKDVYIEAKGSGFDTAILRKIIKERRVDPDDLSEQELLIDLYRRALAGWEKTPLGEYSEAAE